jgi:5S rRNA maturation endonuclease (ribonuclease M5)
MVRQDPKGNAVFPHYDSAGLSGYELKNKDFTGFSRGGSKGLWFSTNAARADRVVVVESAIDALSHAALSDETGAAYLSTGGSLGGRQRALLTTALAGAAARGATIVIATDADKGGDELAREVGQLVPAGAKVERERPTTGKDWNDQLRMGPSRSRSSGYSMGM